MTKQNKQTINHMLKKKKNKKYKQTLFNPDFGPGKSYKNF